MTNQSDDAVSVKPLLYALAGTVLLAVGGMLFVNLDEDPELFMIFAVVFAAPGLYPLIAGRSPTGSSRLVASSATGQPLWLNAPAFITHRRLVPADGVDCGHPIMPRPVTTRSPCKRKGPIRPAFEHVRQHLVATAQASARTRCRQRMTRSSSTIMATAAAAKTATPSTSSEMRYHWAGSPLWVTTTFSCGPT